MNLEAYILSSISYAQSGKLEDLQKIAEELVAKYPAISEGHYLRGYVAEQAGNLEKAATSYKNAFLRDPLNMSVLTKLVNILIKLKNTKSAKEQLKVLQYLFVLSPTTELLRLLVDYSSDTSITGSVGIHCGYVTGWMLLPDKDEPIFLVSEEGMKFTIRRSPVRDGLTCVTFLGEFVKPASHSYTISARGRYGLDINGSPLIYDPPEFYSHRQRKGADVSLIIPISGLEDVKVVSDCLESVADSLQYNLTETEVIVVYDSAEPTALRSYVEKFSLKNSSSMRLIINPLRRGFIGSVNIGLLHSSGDVIILNSDTIVHGNWIDRLKKSAYSHPRIGTVTPFGSWSEITSVPYPPVRRPINKKEVAKWDTLCSKKADETAILIPWGVGFCMYIKKDVIKSIGGFNGRLLMNGYGEEVEFCLRASELGWMNVASPLVFIGHQGCESFNEMQKLMLAVQNNRAIESRWLHARFVYYETLKNDPLKTQREKIWGKDATKPM